MYISRCAKGYKTNTSQQAAVFTGLVAHGLLSGRGPTSICKWRKLFLGFLGNQNEVDALDHRGFNNK